MAKIPLGGDLFSHSVTRAVSSALGRFTSVFEMGTGGSTPLEPPKDFFAGLVCTICHDLTRGFHPYNTLASIGLGSHNHRISVQAMVPVPVSTKSISMTRCYALLRPPRCTPKSTRPPNAIIISLLMIPVTGTIDQVTRVREYPN